MKIISFSLWGDKPIYLVGALRNAKMAKDFYPEFICWFYIHKDTVPIETIEQLEKLDNVKIIYKTGDLSTNKPATWRFEAIDNPEVEFMMSRDVDTQILLREKLAVQQWLNSDKLLHIMRDHPWHNYKIQAGMFGVKKSDITWIDKINLYCTNEGFDYDQVFLQNIIYPLYENNCLIHASFNKLEGNNCIDFPITHDQDDYKFVGEYVYEDETRNEQNTNELKLFLQQQITPATV
jgi:hypothetical protein